MTPEGSSTGAAFTRLTPFAEAMDGRRDMAPRPPNKVVRTISLRLTPVMDE